MILSFYLQLYLIGGADVKSQTEHSLRSSVFMFDVDEKKWHQKADMSQSRACLTTVVLGTVFEFRKKTVEKLLVETCVANNIISSKKKNKDTFFEGHFLAELSSAV